MIVKFILISRDISLNYLGGCNILKGRGGGSALFFTPRKKISRQCHQRSKLELFPSFEALEVPQKKKKKKKKTFSAIVCLLHNLSTRRVPQ